MKTIIEVEFQSEKQAQQAAKILKESKTDEETRAKIDVKTKGKKVVVAITADDFTSLRAMTTTTLRDLKVITDGFKTVEKTQSL